MNTKPTLIFIFVLIYLLSCDPASNKLKIYNGSNSSIYATYTFDSFNPTNDNPIKYFMDNQILPKDTGHLHLLGGDKDWGYFIEKSSNKKINIFIFSIDSIEKYGYNFLANDKNYYKQYSYTQEGLDSIKWVVKIN
jgi:hypothetical protein